MINAIAGIDEAGRGCLAGPVAAAAVILDSEMPIPGLKDSKKLSPGKREKLALEIKKYAISWSVGLVWQKRIDQSNILVATFEAMAQAVRLLKILPFRLNIDGPYAIPDEILACALKTVKTLPEQKAIIDGDQLQPEISAASIIAKDFRDRLMKVFDKRWPQYNFAQHKGYGTKAHFAALREYGVCPLHRLSFRGVLNPYNAIKT